MAEVLIINPNSEITDKIQKALGERFHCTSVQNSNEAKTLLESIHFDALFLDFKDGLGFNLFKGQKAPVFVISDQSTSSDRVLAFSLGATDFIEFPFHPNELKARVASKLRQKPQTIVQGKYQKGSITANYENHVIQINEHVTNLTHVEFQIFMKLFKNPGRPMSREEIFENMDLKGVDKGSRKVDAHVSNLRRKLGPYDRILGSVYGRGYVFRENFL